MGAEVFYQCNYGYRNVGEGNVSVCAAAGQWEKPAVVCQGTVKTTFRTCLRFSLWFFHFVLKAAGLHHSRCMLFVVETLCGSPPVIESTKQVWNNNSTPGSTVLYVCIEGFRKKEGQNVSVCDDRGQWSFPSLVCQGVYDISCSSVGL